MPSPVDLLEHLARLEHELERPPPADFLPRGLLRICAASILLISSGPVRRPTAALLRVV